MMPVVLQLCKFPLIVLLKVFGDFPNYICIIALPNPKGNPYSIHVQENQVKKQSKLVLVVLLVMVLSAASYAFAATNTVPASVAGDGKGAIAGYAVSGITYVLDTTNPSLIASVKFTLDETAATVKAELSNTAGTITAWSSACTLTTGVYTCTFGSGFNVVDAFSLRVVAAQ